MSDTLRLAAPAKVNLRLVILARETSGYHQLETLFCGVDLCDQIAVEPGPSGIELDVQGDRELGPVEDNLVYRAAQAFLRAADIDRGVRIHLQKAIPSAAGMGGGSSDAAATLKALNSLFGHPLDAAAVLRLGNKLGSDVPFFLTPTPYALAWGRGERLMSLPPLPSRPVLVAHPGVPMPTPEAFRRLAELRGGDYSPAAESFDLDSVRDWEGVAALAANDFEAPALERIPQLVEALDSMRNAGALVAHLCGSGAAVFGVFADEQARDGAWETIRSAGWKCWRCRTLESWPGPMQQD